MDQLSAEDKQALEELRQYMLCNEGSWVVGDGFLNFIGTKIFHFLLSSVLFLFVLKISGRLLNDPAYPLDARLSFLNILSAAALKDDVILVLHQDRKDHILMNYAFGIDRLDPKEQAGIALFVSIWF